MISPEILKKVKLLEIKTRHIVNNLFGGEYHSAFKGTGVEFAEVREYIPGDDIKSIDWNVTARNNHPYVKKFNEERELTVLMMLDLSGSAYFGTGELLKNDVMVELAAILSFSAIKNNDKVGLLLFSDKIIKYISPKKGKSHVLRVIREMIYHSTKDNLTNISLAIEHIQKVVKRKSIIFLFSDFHDNYFFKSMKLLNKKHDLINIKIHDDFESNIPNLGLVKLHDVETKMTHWVDTGNKNNRKKILANYHFNNNNFLKYCKNNNIDLININTKYNYIEPLIHFFNSRTNKK